MDCLGAVMSALVMRWIVFCSRLTAATAATQRRLVLSVATRKPVRRRGSSLSTRWPPSLDSMFQTTRVVLLRQYAPASILERDQRFHGPGRRGGGRRVDCCHPTPGGKTHCDNPTAHALW